MNQKTVQNNFIIKNNNKFKKGIKLYFIKL